VRVRAGRRAGRRGRVLLALAALVMLTGAGDPVLVPDVSQHEIVVRQGFTGAQLLLFGAILSPDGTSLQQGGVGQDYDIVVVVEGPSRPIVLRQKQKVAGVWVNTRATTFQSVPSFYAMASTRPICQIVDEQTAAIYELGLPFLQLSPTGSIDPASQQGFSAGLVGLMARSGLYHQDEHGVTVAGRVLYRAAMALPSNVATGSYTAETFAIAHGRVVASAISRIEVRKSGFERAIADFSNHDAFLYGLFVVAASIAMGWLAGRVFARR